MSNNVLQGGFLGTQTSSNQAGIFGNQGGMVCNQGSVFGNQGGMAGNQAGIFGNQGGVTSNQGMLGIQQSQSLPNAQPALGQLRMELNSILFVLNVRHLLSGRHYL